MSRLVIRIKLPPREPPPAPEQPRLRKGALLSIVGVVVIALAAIGIYMFKSEPAPAPVASTQSAPQLAEPIVEKVPEPPAAPPPRIEEVIPEVPQSALNTIRGTIQIIIRVTVDQDGKVLDATPEVNGPSRYFARLALEAAKKWTFAPTDSPERRTMRVRFYFKRSGVTARSGAA